MKRLFLVNDPTTLRISPALAEEIGLNESIMLLQLEFWITTYRNERDGQIWTYQSTRDMQKRAFPFWSVATINRTVKSLEKKELIRIETKYNDRRYDKTRWFTLNPDGFANLKNALVQNVDSAPNQNETGSAHPSHSSQTLDNSYPAQIETGSAQIETGSAQIETGSAQIETGSAQIETRSAQDVTTIPKITTKITTENTAETAAKTDSPLAAASCNFLKAPELDSLEKLINVDVPDHRRQWLADNINQHGFDYVHEKVAYSNQQVEDPDKYWSYLGLAIDKNFGQGFLADLNAKLDRQAKAQEKTKAREKAEAEQRAREAAEREANFEMAEKAKAIFAEMDSAGQVKLRNAFLETAEPAVKERLERLPLAESCTNGMFLHYCIDLMNMIPSEEQSAKGAHV